MATSTVDPNEKSMSTFDRVDFTTPHGEQRTMSQAEFLAFFEHLSFDQRVGFVTKNSPKFTSRGDFVNVRHAIRQALEIINRRKHFG